MTALADMTESQLADHIVRQYKEPRIGPAGHDRHHFVDPDPLVGTIYVQFAELFLKINFYLRA